MLRYPVGITTLADLAVPYEKNPTLRVLLFRTKPFITMQRNTCFSIKWFCEYNYWYPKFCLYGLHKQYTVFT